MMLDALVQGLDVRTKVARLSHTTIAEDELFPMLTSEFGIETAGGGKLEKLRAIQGFLDDWTADGRNAVLVVDEAQNLSSPVLEEIRLLSNLRSHGQCSLQIVLAGQPELRERLEHQDLRQLKQRIGVRYHLTPLSSTETAEYISHRLSVAGSRGARIFDRGATGAIYDYSGGVPRMINILCDRVLVAGYGAGSGRIGRQLVLETIKDLDGGAPVAQARPERPERRSRPAAARRPRRPERSPARMPAWVIPAAVAVGAFAAVAFFATRGGLTGVQVASHDEAPAAASTGAVRVEAPPVSDVTVDPSSGEARHEAEPVVEADVQGAVTSSEAERLAGVDDPLEMDEGGVAGIEPGEPEEELEIPSQTEAVAIEQPLVSDGPYRAIALSSRSLEAARREASRLSASGFPADVVPVDIGDRSQWYRVAVRGGYPTVEAAREVVVKLRRLGHDSAWVERV